jgi:hypothetical protein
MRLTTQRVGEGDEAFRVRRNAYQKDWMRRKRQLEHLSDLEEEAEARGLTPAELRHRLVVVIARDNLFAAILDGEA